MTDTTTDTGDKFVPTAADRAWMKANHRIGWHGQGGWCRKFPGDKNRTYFGWVEPAEAVRAHNAEEDRRARGAQDEAVAEAKIANYTVKDAVNMFLGKMDERLTRGAISDSQRAHYGAELHSFVHGKGEDGRPIVGPDRKLSDLTKMMAPDTIFQPLRNLAIARGITSAEKHIIMVRSFLRWASDVRRLMTAPFYGGNFGVPSKKEQHARKKAVRKAKGAAFWEPAEVREIIEASKGVDVHFHAQVLLMINGGMGATDLSLLEDADIDWNRRCIHTDRSKTLVPRVVPLWDVTVEALKISRAARVDAADPKWIDRVFLTEKGKPIVNRRLDEKRRKLRGSDSVKNRFYTLLNGCRQPGGKVVPGKLAHLKRHGAGAYTLRACFATMAMGQPVELVAVIMGHKFHNPVTEWYARGDLLEKLVGVVEHIRLQLWSV